MTMHTSESDERTAGASERTRVCFITMGCAKNEVDTARMEESVLASGYDVVEEPREADAIIINTCSFIQEATEESLDAIFEAASLPSVEAGRAKIIVAGCMPARYGDDLAEELTEASAFVACSKEDSIVEVLDCVVDAPVAAASERNASAERSVTSAYVKISDGCDRWCSYCTIPLIRGRYHSFPSAAIFADVEKALSRGAREIVLIAQDTGRWGQDFDEPSSLSELVGALAEAHPDTWFRVMYIQPEGVTDDLIETFRTHENVCDYFDIPLQHVNGRILAAMRRHGSKEEFVELVDRIRTAIPHATLRTTLIAGFPGETEEDFEELVDFVEEGLFDYVGVFPYSREEGTKAFDLPDQVDDGEKIARASRIRDIADAASTAIIAERRGSTVKVLIEGAEEDGQLFGRAMSQAPDVDGCTYVDAGSVGDIVEATIVDTLFYEMEGEVHVK